MEMKVEIRCKESIKPSSPTPNCLSTHKLSFFDQIAPPVYIPILLFYPSSTPTPTPTQIDPVQRCHLLKTSLSKTLTYLYPFAGRVRDCYTIECNDDGATYVEAEVDTDMCIVMKEPKIDMLLQLLPLDPVGQPSCEILLGIQVNHFACGGMALGVCVRHVVADASAVASFLKTWAALAKAMEMGMDEQLGIGMGLVHDTTSLFPPQDVSALWKAIEKNQTCVVEEVVVTNRFVFHASKIQALRKEIGKGSTCAPTRVEALSSLIWNAIAKQTDGMHVATTAVNLRRRMNPQFPMFCMGNIYHITMANSFTNISRDVLAEEIHQSIQKIDDKFVRQFYGSGTHLNVIKGMATELGESSKAGAFNFSSWCRFPFYETDFGWGKPLWFGTALRLNKVAIFLDTSDGGGIEAWIGLTKEEMAKLEQDPGILAYASFIPTI